MKSIFSLNYRLNETFDLIKDANHKVLAQWAIDCVERVLQYFENEYPHDNRPMTAIQTLKEWMRTGEFKMSIIRRASLDSHAAARDIAEDNSAKSAARAAGQAVATAHVRTHSVAAANYALQAVYRSSSPENADQNVANERAWQIERLLELMNKSN